MILVRYSIFLIVLCLLAACGGEEAEAPVETYEFRGEVLRLVPEDKVAVIKHEDIEGWMKAMTMDFPVKDEAEFQKLSVGQQIEAKVYVQDLDFWIADIEVKNGQ